MLPNIQEKYESLRKKREVLLQQLGSLPSEELSFKAGPDKWSIVEVVEHLVIVEKDLLKQLSVNVPTSTLDLKSKTPQKHQTVIKVMERDIAVDVPDESMEPQGSLSLDELLNQWDDIRKKIQRALSEMKSENKDNLVYQHPFGGPLDIVEALQFVDVHFDNHIRHIDRILDSHQKCQDPIAKTEKNAPANSHLFCHPKVLEQFL
jgi:hypothetical protein